MGKRLRISRPTGRAGAATAGLLLAAAVVSPLGAGTAAAAADFSPYGARLAPGTTGQISPQIKDSLWGGYVAQGSFGRITGSWTEPHVTCNTYNDLFAPWVGIDGYGSQTVEQTGVQTDCSSGTPVLSAWYEMYPAQPVYWNDPVSEGDSMTGTVVSNGGGSYTLTLTDNTKGWTERTSQYLYAQNVSAEAVIESPTRSYPSFSELDFSGIRVDGQVFDSYSPGSLTSGGYTPGPLRNGAFSMTPGFAAKHSTATPNTTHPNTVRPNTVRPNTVRPSTIRY
ncbi:G1 family endopeptidase [Streptomyces sp. GXMU-J5]|uniref:G1 family endopeptidase n=2 Tax=Streptomyces beihaiensis TaxID=2984495 RepID=A0ABT3U270_9ACTN|nr:G1 family endopeptidase [Streptomyces beihaiensis]